MDDALRHAWASKPACDVTGPVSILVLMDDALRHRQSTDPEKAVKMFQSLFSWMTPFGSDQTSPPR